MLVIIELQQELWNILSTSALFCVTQIAQSEPTALTSKDVFLHTQLSSAVLGLLLLLSLMHVVESCEIGRQMDLHAVGISVSL